MDEETKESLQVDAVGKDLISNDADVDLKTSVEPTTGEAINKTDSDMCDSPLKEESNMNGGDSSVAILPDTKPESTDTQALDSNSKSPDLDGTPMKSHNSNSDEDSECVISFKESSNSSNFIESLKVNCTETSSATNDSNPECKNSNVILISNEHCDAVETVNECQSQDSEVNKSLENNIEDTNVNNESQFDNKVLSPKKEEKSISTEVNNVDSIIEDKNVISTVIMEEKKILKSCDEKMEVGLVILEGDANSSVEQKISNSDPDEEVSRTSIDIEEENFKVEEEEGTNAKNDTKGNELDQTRDEVIESSSEIEKSNEFLCNNLENNATNETEKVDVEPLEVTTSFTSENSHEVEKIEESVIKSDIVQEENNKSNMNSSASSMEVEGDNINRIESDGIEIMNTEMVNCNEIEMIELTENEESKEKEIDRIGTDSCSDLDSKNNDKTAGIVDDVLGTDFNEKITKCNDNNLNLLMIDDCHKSENSESEAFTGDTTRTSIENNKDEDVCIIPDSMTPRLSMKTKVKGTSLKKKDDKVSEDSDINLIDVTACESDKAQQSSQKKKREDGIIKARPTRNAAKLAGNKIRTLVLNDLLDRQGSGSNSKSSGGLPPNLEESHRVCVQCKEVKLWRYLMVHGDINQYLCSEECSEAFAKSCQAESDSQDGGITSGEFIRKCAHCCSQVVLDDRWLFWETMDFCNEDCLGKYQTKLGSNCTNCKGNVFPSSLGKYCVRFGCDVKQFCSSACLEEYKKGLKVCSYCQKDMSSGAEGFLAPVGDKGQFKDFCSQACMEKYEQMSINTPAPEVIEECAVCSNCKPVCIEVELDNKLHKLCSEPCYAAFKFVNNITEGHCDMCKKYFDRTKVGKQSVFYDESLRVFCSKTCMNVYILANRKIVPCNWCKVKKYNFDMIRKGKSSNQIMMCSLNCLTLHALSMSTVTSGHGKCDFCLAVTPAQYHLTMSDGTVRIFCNYSCAVSFQNQYPKPGVDVISNEQLTSPIPTGVPRKVTPRRSQMESPRVPVISSVQSLASSTGTLNSSTQFPISGTNTGSQVDSQKVPDTSPVTAIPAPPPQIYQQIITKPPPAKVMKNKSILCKPYSHTKGVSCRPLPCMKETQTDQSLNRKFIIPIPVPIYVPCPMHMFATPFPVPVPFALPVPVPIFIPTTRNSAKGIMKEIKKIQEKIPTDPFEAELLMMAEMVAGDKKQDPTDSESEEGNDGDDGGDGTFSPNNVDANNTFGDDMLQMALKMATELEEPAVDMESVLTSNTITTQTQPPVDPNKTLYGQANTMQVNRGRKRSVRGGRNSTSGTPNKRGRRTSGSVDVPLLPPPEPVPPPRIEVEKPDADMCLKYTFGVNAWRHWVVQKNAELEKVAMTNRKIKLFKPDLLQLTADELNFSLCLFVKEVRKPNGTEYAPDTIYYLCLGIQQYLFENGRIDNIFTDSYYEKFTDCLDEVAKKFAALYSDSQYIVTRVEEEHLWESKQLGAHSPHVLLSTLMFFNTKHFNLVTVEEHMQLSFSHIMKHWKRNPNTPGVAKVPGSRNVLLRFYPPQSALEANSRKKKVYEQQENEENPLRCPVKLYEFYLSKCPESVKTRNDVFYLLPERSCVPDSPVWYSTMALGKEPLMKMLHRVKMVKEINIALLSC